MSQGGAVGETQNNGNISAMRNSAPTPAWNIGSIYASPPTATNASPIGAQQNPDSGPLPQSPMIPFSQQDLPPQLQQLAKQYGVGGKGGVPGQTQPQSNPMQAQQAMSQGLGALMTAQQKPQSSLNSLQ